MADSSQSISRFSRQTAHRLRTNATNAENRLWRGLRQLPMQGSHFRRQVPIGPYVVDFACMAAKLIVEVDGSQHGREDNIEQDKIRTSWLQERGYRVLRFWNSDVTSNLDGVLAVIYASVYGSTEIVATSLKHARRSKAHHPTPARKRADPPLPGEGE